MILISHRGNLKGPNLLLENSPEQIDLAIQNGLIVEVDLRVIENNFWLGHDTANYLVSENWILNRKNSLVIHSKDLITSDFLAEFNDTLNWFYHTDEDVVLTSKGWLWCYPGIYLSNGITVIKDNSTLFPKKVKGICTDYPLLFK
jgi:hypothetical protein